jgi:23S rRNA (cytidine1920-2'-O)/16S rRNA (cytidine1409-2'-O)-methyltransferase
VEHGYFESRNRALEAIKAGEVTLDGKRAKASQKVTENSQIIVTSGKFYVSRAAKKLETFLATHPIALEDKVALDIGSSTGGFAQILLEHNIASLDCVDVGSDQLHHSLKEHPKLSLHEETDIRVFDPHTKFTLITWDVSFISILQIIDDIDRLASNACDIIILYKPQFEVGREVKRDSRGVVQDTQAITTCQETFIAKTEVLDWKFNYHAPSKIAGKEGNQEHLYHFVKM